MAFEYVKVEQGYT